MNPKILVVALGGTIGSVKEDCIQLSENRFKILDYCKRDDIEFCCASPFAILSENITKEHWQSLIDYLESVDFSSLAGVIILHGSDTLAYTSSIIANAFPDESIVLVASSKPVEDKDSNAIENLDKAIQHILEGKKGVYVSYDGIKKGDQIASADINDVFREISSPNTPSRKRKISSKDVLVIKAYAGLDMRNYRIENVDEILVEMFHSATVPKSTIEYLEAQDIPYHFVTHKTSADYETTQDTKNIIFGSTIENAFAKAILE